MYVDVMNADWLIYFKTLFIVFEFFYALQESNRTLCTELPEVCYLIITDTIGSAGLVITVNKIFSQRLEFCHRS